MVTLTTERAAHELARIENSLTEAQRDQIEQVRAALPSSALDEGEDIVALLAELRLDAEMIIAALLVPYAAQQPSQLTTLCNQPTIVTLVDGVLRLDLIVDIHRQGRRDAESMESLRKMLLAMVQDIRIVLIRLAWCAVQMRRLDDYPDMQRLAMARETRDIFAPLANRLGIGRIKWELEDLAMRHLEPQVYRQLAQALEQRRSEREHYIEKAVQTLRLALHHSNIQSDVSGRVKHIYSIWRKMQRKNLAFDDLFDIRAMRILVPTVNDCYAALGSVHALWNHISREFDDYIANPKGNGYQSLHTAVHGPEGRVVEVQIRTHDMHQSAELGVAAHWRYKEGTSHGSGNAFERQVAWLRKILDGNDDEGADILERFESEALLDRVYALTPRGDIIDLPQGATVLDFAYYIHTEVGHRCRGAKINGHIVPLTQMLQNGDQITVLTAKQGAPSRDWLSIHLGYLNTPRARAKVRSWFRQLDREKNIQAGRQELERECQRLNMRLHALPELAAALGYDQVDGMLAAMSLGDLSLQQVMNRFIELDGPPTITDDDVIHTSRAHSAPSGADGQFVICGVGNLMTSLAHCCRPLPGDAVIGFLTVGRGVSVHRTDCPNVLGLQSRFPERIIEVEWGHDEAQSEQVCTAGIEVVAYDRTGLLRDIAAVLANEKANVLTVNTRTEQGEAHMSLTVEIRGLEQLSRLLRRISRLPNVMHAARRRSD